MYKKTKKQPSYSDISDINSLRVGAIVRSKSTGIKYMIISNRDNVVMAVQTVDITHSKDLEMVK